MDTISKLIAPLVASSALAALALPAVALASGQSTLPSGRIATLPIGAYEPRWFMASMNSPARRSIMVFSERPRAAPMIQRIASA